MHSFRNRSNVELAQPLSPSAPSFTACIGTLKDENTFDSLINLTALHVDRLSVIQGGVQGVPTQICRTLEMTVDPDDVQPEVFSARDINLEDIEEESLQGIVVLIGCALALRHFGMSKVVQQL